MVKKCQGARCQNALNALFKLGESRTSDHPRSKSGDRRCCTIPLWHLGTSRVGTYPCYWVSVNRRLIPRFVFALGKVVLITGLLITRS